MVKDYITENYEFYEVLNAFPVLSETLDKLEIDDFDIVEGRTVLEVLVKQGFTHEEIGLLVRKMNQAINSFLSSSQKIYRKESVSNPLDLGISYL